MKNWVHGGVLKLLTGVFISNCKTGYEALHVYFEEK